MATEIAGYLSQEEIALFYQQGYVVKKSMVAQNISTLREQCSRIVSTAKQKVFSNECAVTDPSVREDYVYINGTQVVYKKHSETTAAIRRVVGCGGMEEGVLKTLRSYEMVKTFFDLLKTNQIEHLICQCHPKESGDAVEYRPHRDETNRKLLDSNWKNVNTEGSDYAICIIAIDRMSKENGGLEVLRNSHTRLDAEITEEDTIELVLEPGDAVFMHQQLLHWSKPNNSEGNRYTLLTGYCAYGANSKPYPGALVNTVFTLHDRTIIGSDAPWKSRNVEVLGNH